MAITETVEAARGGSTRTRGGRVIRVLRRVPLTLVVAIVLLGVGVLTGGLWSAVEDRPWYEAVAYGLPAYQAGHWWSMITGTFLLAQPIGYLGMIVLVPAGLGWLEWRRGTGIAAGYFFGGQLFALMAAAMFVMIAAGAGSGWAQQLGAVYDVGPSGGLFACLTAAACSLAQPWRGRAQYALAAYSVVSLMFLGSFADLEHTVAVAGVLLLNVRTISLPTIREQRLLGWVSLLALAAVEVITFFVPTFGPFGSPDPAEVSFADLAVDVVVVGLIAHGIRRGYRFAWVIALLLAVLNVLVGVLAVLLLALGGGIPEVAAQRDDLSIAAASATLWLLMLAYLVFTRRAFRVRLRRRIPGGVAGGQARARAIVQVTGGGVLSWMATWRDNLYFFDPAGDAFVAYQRHAGVAIALSDPIAPEADAEALLRRWAQAAEAGGLVPCVFGASATLAAGAPDGWRALQIAEDTIVDLPGLEFTGKRWNVVRTSLNRAGREQMRFRLTRLADEPWNVRRQIDEISEQWVGDKDLPEMRFTLGGIPEALDPAVRLAVAEREDGTVDGFLSWLPVYAPGGAVRGWTLDLMRRRKEGGFGPVMEFLIASSAAAFRDEGAELLSLSGAPLARSGTGPEGVIDRVLDRLGALLEPVYGFRSLHRFKQKFNPRTEPIHLLYRDESDLGRIGLGITRSFLPDATVGDLVRAGLSTVREVAVEAPAGPR